MIRRVFVEKRPGFDIEAQHLLADLRENLSLSGLQRVRVLARYDVEGLTDEEWAQAVHQVFSEPQADTATETLQTANGESVFAVEYLPGQYDQRADSAGQCIQILTHKTRPRIATAKVYAFTGLGGEDLPRVKSYLINAVDSRESSLEKPDTLETRLDDPADVPVIEGFREYSQKDMTSLRERFGLAMTGADLAFCQAYFRQDEGRDPTETELRLLDTYWSDHCRHTTFLTEITRVGFDDSPLNEPVRAAFQQYLKSREAVYGERLRKKPVCLMDIATLGMKELRQQGNLDDLEESEEINAASIVVPVEVDGKTEEWLIQFKNETHNHPTEIEPFGGAATCLGGAIRDPLSGRAYVYQAMRVTGAADPRQPVSETLPGKLPQRKICIEAAHGYSSYGNQIGLATGQVHEIYHPGFLAKRMEIGAVIAATPRANVQRGSPEPGDVILLVGGRTGRDGIGGATGSSKEHTDEALENSAEVQKGDPVMERKLQRLFRRPEAAKMIVRCNDFGAGGVSVAIGELAPSLEIDLDQVPKKYEGLNGTEIAISESQERMAVVLRADDVERFQQYVAAENLEARAVASVTDSGRLTMSWRGQNIVDLSREFLDSNGASQQAEIHVSAPKNGQTPLDPAESEKPLAERWEANLSDLSRCSQKGLIERFDSTIGASSILHPYGGRYRATPPEAMAALVPTEGETTSATLMSFGYNPEIASWSPFHGAVYAVVESLAKIVATGGELHRIRLTFQEYFERLRDDPRRWGKPFAALLGALAAQREMGVAAIGGKDSMSGSFNDLDVPPTLVSFAVAPVDARHVISPEFKATGNHVILLEAEREANGLPNWQQLKDVFSTVSAGIRSGEILSAHSVRAGGVAEAVSRMAFGNRIGMQCNAEVEADALFAPAYGSFVLEVTPDATIQGTQLGQTIVAPELQIGETKLSLEPLHRAWSAPLEKVYATQAEASGPEKIEITSASGADTPRTATAKIARPRVLIPVFPGNNCEFDTAKAFRRAGAEPVEFVFRNRSSSEVEESLDALAKALDKAQILMLPGGFTAGDEPDGSGKFTAAVFRNPIVRDATMRLLQDRDGLCLGICNGFQALIKLGLLPYGEIRDCAPSDPTLTFNRIGRHVSCYVQTRVVSSLSPWLSACKPGDVHTVAVSHGEGRFVADEAMMQRLIANGQIATQYVDPAGKPSMWIDANPNGSAWAVEGITSPDGRVFGKMAHSERAGPYVGINVPGNRHEPIFEGGVQYFA